MPDQLYGLTIEDIRWLRRLRADLDAGRAQIVRRRGAFTGPNVQVVKPSSATLDTSDANEDRYPGHWYERNPSTGAMTQKDAVWIVTQNGETVNTSDYLEGAIQHGFENSRPVFVVPDAMPGAGGGGTTITVEEADGSPSYGSIDTVRFDQADGFVLTNPAAGVARVDQTAASATTVGYVNTSSQVFAGTKAFGDGLQSKDYVTLVDSTGVTTKTCIFDLISSATPFFADCYISMVNSSNSDEVQLYFVLASGVIISATDNGSLVDAAYGVQDSGGTVTYGDYGTDGIGNVVKGGLVTTVSSASVPTWVSAPSTTSSSGTAGQMAYAFNIGDSKYYLYVCVGTDTWQRVQLASW